jgi:hypothetical protein
MGNEDPRPANDPDDLRQLLGENGVRVYYDGVYGYIGVQMFPNEPIPRITLRVTGLQCSGQVLSEALTKLLDCLHDAFVDCDRLGVQACACYDVQNLPRPALSHAKMIIEWMGDKDTPDGNREELLQNVVRAVAIVLVNTWAGAIITGLMSFMDAVIKPEQPNKVFFNESGVGPFLSGAVQGRVNASRPRACNRVAGHVPRGNLVGGSGETCLGSPKKGTIPSTSASGSATSEAESTLDKTPTAVVILPQEEEAVVDEATVKPPAACERFRWFACGLPDAWPATAVDETHVN